MIKRSRGRPKLYQFPDKVSFLMEGIEFAWWKGQAKGGGIAISRVLKDALDFAKRVGFCVLRKEPA